MGADNPNRFDIFGMTTGGGDNFNPAELFMTPGLNKSDAKDLTKLIMRSVFESRDEVTKFTNFLSKCLRTGNMDGVEDAKHHLTGKAAIKGRASSLGLQFGTGTIAPDVILDTTDSSIKGRLGKVFRRDRRNHTEPAHSYNGNNNNGNWA